MVQCAALSKKFEHIKKRESLPSGKASPNTMRTPYLFYKSKYRANVHVNLYLDKSGNNFRFIIAR